MTLFLISLSTKGFWASLFDITVGLQLKHRGYDAPYVFIHLIRWEFILGFHSLIIKRYDRIYLSDGTKSRIWNVVYEWVRGGKRSYRR